MATRTRTLRQVAAPPVRRPRGLAPIDAFRPASRRAATAAPEAVRLGQVDGWLLASIAGLCAFGLVMVYSASEAVGFAQTGNPSYYFERQVVAVALGITGMLIAARVDYRRWRDWSSPFAWVCVVLLVLVLLPHIGSERLGARRWFDLGPVSLQPSAVATLMAVVWLSRWLVDHGPAVRTLPVVWKFALRFGGLLLLIVAEKDLGSTVILASIGVVVLALAGARKRHFVVLLGGLALLAYLAIHLEAYRAARLQSFRDPFADPLNTGFQPVQSLLALGSGGFSGVGLGNSVAKYQWLPEAHTDFIFAIIGEELGLIGALAVIAGFLALTWRGVRAALRAPDTYGALVAGGITAWIGIQAFVNIAAVTILVPTTGITLPFISYGGSSLVVTLVACGVLCNISAQGRRQGVPRRAYVDRWRGNGRSSDPGTGAGTRAAAR